MSSPGSFSLNTAAMRQLTSPQGQIARSLLPRVRRVEAQAKRLAPVDTGRMRSSIHLDGPHAGPDGPYYDILAATNYAIFVHEGTRFLQARPFLLNALYSVIR